MVNNIKFKELESKHNNLEKERIRIVVENVDKEYGRTIEFNTQNDRVKITSVGRSEKII